MKNKFIFLLYFILSINFLVADNETDYVKYVNPLIGTDTSFELSNGNTYPAIARPWGMNFWTPQTPRSKILVFGVPLEFIIISQLP